MTQEWEGGKIERTAEDDADSRDFQKSWKDAQEREPIVAAARRSGANGCLMMILVCLFGFTPLFVDYKNVPVYLIVAMFVAVGVLCFIGSYKIHKADKVLYGKRK
jgi:hypothetical protein